MKLTVSKFAGFCPGTSHADNVIKELLAKKAENDRIYTLGKLIHNRTYVEALEALGVMSIGMSDVEQILKQNENGKTFLVIRTHGIGQCDGEYLNSLSSVYPNLEIIDATCPSVKKIHRIALQHTGEDTHFVLYGNADHPETKGIISYVKGDYSIISSFDDAKSLEFKGKIPILCAQTTQNLLEFIKIKNFFKKVYTNAIFFDTICSVTEKRQQEALLIAKESDAMVVLGGYDRSNTRKLYELCKDVCPNTIWCETVHDLTTAFSDSIKSVGITAGASTPDGIILEVLKKYGKL